MEAVIVCCNQPPLPKAVARLAPLCLLPVLNRPVLARMLETLALMRASRVICVLDNACLAAEEAIGFGDDAGARVEYLLVPEFTGLVEALHKIRPSLSENFLLFSRLMLFGPEIAELHALHLRSLAAVTFVPKRGGEAPEREAVEEILCLNRASLGIPALQGLTSADAFVEKVRATQARVNQHPDPVSVHAITDLAGLHRANMLALKKRWPHFTLEEPRREAGIRLGPGCRIHEQATLKAPLVLGPGCEVMAKAIVGPGAVLGASCLVDAGAEVTDSVLLSGSYLGPRAGIDKALVLQSLLVKIPAQILCSVTDPFHLGSGQLPTPPNWLSNVLQRVLAAQGLILLAPLFLAHALFRRDRGRAAIQRLPAAGRATIGPSGDFTPHVVTLRVCDSERPLTRFYPALLDVVLGRAGLIGVEPLSPDEARELRAPWERLRFQASPGLINPWHAFSRRPWAPETKRAMENYYARDQSLATDFGIALRAVREFFRRPAAPVVKPETPPLSPPNSL